MMHIIVGWPIKRKKVMEHILILVVIYFPMVKNVSEASVIYLEFIVDVKNIICGKRNNKNMILFIFS
jgi:hypothetical protein